MDFEGYWYTKYIHIEKYQLHSKIEYEYFGSIAFDKSSQLKDIYLTSNYSNRVKKKFLNEREPIKFCWRKTYG